MPIDYALLVGQVRGGDREDDDPYSPHYSIFVAAGRDVYRVPVNVQSQDGSEVLYYHDEDFDNPLLDNLEDLRQGLIEIDSTPNGLALDYVRGKYFDQNDMKALPATVPGVNNDLQDIINKLVVKSKQQRQTGALIYVFGEQFSRGKGMHDIHMNQGSPKGRFSKYNGVWQDGGLIFHFPDDDRFEALFFAFQSQRWQTDDVTGHPVDDQDLMAESIQDPNHNNNRNGYKEDFLGQSHVMPLPTFGDQLMQDVVKSPKLKHDHLSEHPYYSVVMHQSRRQAIFSAANADFDRKGFVIPKRKNAFRFDPNIEEQFQLGESYYDNDSRNDESYDRGHLTKRHAVARGLNKAAASQASKDSFYFSNIALQDHDFHHGAWGKLERAIANSRHDVGDDFNVITGCIFTDNDKVVKPSDDGAKAFAPSGFFKVISFVGKNSGQVEVCAFVVFQNKKGAKAVKDKVKGRTIEAFKVYQTSTTLIEALTGLEFADVYRDSNPLMFFAQQLEANLNADDINRPQLEEIDDQGHGLVFA